MKLQHPGPWTYRKGPVDFHIDSADHVMSIAVACDEDVAAAIAALPDMLAALIEAEDWFNVGAGPAPKAVKNKVSAAIAKATQTVRGMSIDNRDMKLRNAIALVLQVADNDHIPNGYADNGHWHEDTSDWSAYLADAIVSAMENSGYSIAANR